MFLPLKEDPVVSSIIRLSDSQIDRLEFHKQSHQHLRKMSSVDFVSKAFEVNLADDGYLKRQWSNYEIPFLYIFENNNFYLKYHIFPPVKSQDTEKAANIIHHHNNYILSSYLMFGPGYHTCHFGKEIKELDNGEVKMSLEKDFFHDKGEINIVESWEPHIVFNMSDTTTTIVLWSPEKKLPTDGLRNNPIIKPFKKFILSLVHGLGLDRSIGVAPKHVKQYYVEDGKVKSISEEDYFAFYKEQVGDEINSNYVQAVCHFVQRMGYKNDEFLLNVLKRKDLPEAWKFWLPYLINDNEIPCVYGKEEINIPKKEIRIEDLRKAFEDS